MVDVVDSSGSLMIPNDTRLFMWLIQSMLWWIVKKERRFLFFQFVIKTPIVNTLLFLEMPQWYDFCFPIVKGVITS